MNKKIGKYLIAGMLLLFIPLVFLTGCGNGENADGMAHAGENDDERTIVTFWHSMSGVSAEGIDQIVEGFNNSQEDIQVIAEYQGSYEEALTKFHAIAGTDSAPSIMQVFEIGTKSMVQSDHIIPIQEFIDRDNHDMIVLEENIINYYRINGQFYSMPFNSSTPVMFFNKDAFEAAGLDPNTPPATFEEIEEAGRAIVEAHDGMRGFALPAWGWMFEQLLANQGALLMNNNNGRTATPTEIGFTEEEGKSIFNWIERMVADETFANYGRNRDDMSAGFLAGDVAMKINSSARTGDIIDNAPFEVGVAYIPHPEAREREGVVIGGASLWLVDNGNEVEQEAAWEFMKYVQRPYVQANWHITTGGLAINPEAYNEQVVIDAYEEMPQLQVTVSQLQSTNPSYATQGAIMDMIPLGRTIIETAFEEVFNGGDVDAAFQTAVEQLNQAITNANLARGE